jgi:hypothetical protein
MQGEGVLQVKLTLPLSVTLPRKKGPDKVFILNLNHYRNTHHMVLNQAKVAWKEVVANAGLSWGIGWWDDLPSPPYRFHYTVYPGSNRAFDLANVLPVVQKFTDDALIELGVIPDDNHKVIRSITYDIGEVDKLSPRVELVIQAWR